MCRYKSGWGLSHTQFVRDSQQQSTWFLNWWVATICKADLGTDVYYVFFCLSLWLLASSWDPREVMRQNAGQCTRVLTPPPTRHSATLATTRSARPATLTRKVVTRGNVEAICYSFLPECRLNVTMYISQTEYHNQWYFNISNVDGLSQCSTTYDEKCETIYETSYERWVITFFFICTNYWEVLQGNVPLLTRRNVLPPMRRHTKRNVSPLTARSALLGTDTEVTEDMEDMGVSALKCQSRAARRSPYRSPSRNASRSRRRTVRTSQ